LSFETAFENVTPDGIRCTEREREREIMLFIGKPQGRSRMISKWHTLYKTDQVTKESKYPAGQYRDSQIRLILKADFPY